MALLRQESFREGCWMLRL